jgi:hypothetical protein
MAVGLTVGMRPIKPLDDDVLHVFGELYVDWFVVLLAAVSAAMVIGLIQEAMALGRLRSNQAGNASGWRFTIVVAAAWRIVTAALLTTCLVIRLLANRDRLSFPDVSLEHGDLWMTELWWLTMIAVLCSMLASSRDAPRPRRRVWDDVAAILAASVIIALGAIFHGFIHYLVHVACADFDAANKHSVGRYQLTSQADQAWIASVGGAAMAAWSAAACLLVDVLRCRRSGLVGRVETCLGVLLLVAAAGYYLWFELFLLPHASPDFASAGRASSWTLDVGAGVMVVILATAGALRWSRLGAPGDDGLTIVYPHVLYRSMLCTWLLVVAGIVLGYDWVRMVFVWSATIGEALEFVAYMASMPPTYLQLAIVILGIRLTWRSSKHRTAVGTLVIERLSPGRFFVAWTTLVALIVVGAGTVAGFSFSWWLGPWYTW